jgi:AcrR family transcriptional regulator
MPKVADPLLRSAILAAAERLLERGSESAVTMRAVAEEAGIAVTTVYERFDGREGLLRALAVHFAATEAQKFLEWTTVEQVFDHYLDFAQANPYRYKLMVDSFFERLGSGSTVPGFELLKSLLAKRFGGNSAQYDELGMGIMELMAGTVMGLMAAGNNRDHQTRAKVAAKSTLDRILGNGRKKQA